jgi:hypothetical protein
LLTVLAEVLAAVKAAASVGHQRAELNATLAIVTCSFALGEPDSQTTAARRSHGPRNFVRRLGAWRFEQNCLIHLGRLALAEGHRSEAIAGCGPEPANRDVVSRRYHSRRARVDVLAAPPSDGSRPAEMPVHILATHRRRDLTAARW